MTVRHCPINLKKINRFARCNFTFSELLRLLFKNSIKTSYSRNWSLYTTYFVTLLSYGHMHPYILCKNMYQTNLCNILSPCKINLLLILVQNILFRKLLFSLWKLQDKYVGYKLVDLFFIFFLNINFDLKNISLPRLFCFYKITITAILKYVNVDKQSITLFFITNL